MLPVIPLPSAADVARVILGTLVTAGGLAAMVAPAPYNAVLPLPLSLLGALIAVPVLIRE